MRKRTKKGFTLVELLVVIAILAILASVSVVGYLGFTGKAKQSADEQAVTQMNTALQAQEAIDKPDNYDEAKIVLEEAGFNVDGYIPLYANNIFYYVPSENRVLIYDQKKEMVTFPENLKDKFSSSDSNFETEKASWNIFNDHMYEEYHVSWDDDSSNDSFELKQALIGLKDYQTLVLDKDVSLLRIQQPSELGVTDCDNLYVNLFPTNKQGTARIDLNGHSLRMLYNYDIGCFASYSWYQKVQEFSINQNVTIFNGTIDFNDAGSRLSVQENSSLTLENVEIKCDADKGDTNGFIQAYNYADVELNKVTYEHKYDSTNDKYDTNGKFNDTVVYLAGTATSVIINDSHFTTRSYGIKTTAGQDESLAVNLNINNSTVISLQNMSMLLNVVGNYRFNNSHFVGNGQGVVVRGGDATFTDCEIVEDGDCLNKKSYIFNEANDGWEFSQADMFKVGWKDGNKLQFGALIVGDWNSSSYNYDASCKLINTSVSMNDDWTELPVVYLSQDKGEDGTKNLTTSFTYDDNCKFFKNGAEISAENDNTSDYAIRRNTAEGSNSLKPGTVTVNGKTIEVGA